MEGLIFGILRYTKTPIESRKSDCRIIAMIIRIYSRFVVQDQTGERLRRATYKIFRTRIKSYHDFNLLVFHLEKQLFLPISPPLIGSFFCVPFS